MKYKILRTVAEAPASAPSAPPAAAAVPPPTTPEPKPLTTLADFERMARESIVVAPSDEAAREDARPTATPPTTLAPVQPAATESPAAPAEPPAIVASEQPDAEPDEPTPEELASLGDAGKRALDSERTKRKEARAELKAAQEKIAELEAQAAARGDARPTNPNEAAPAVPVTPTPPSPAAVPQNLAECQTFDQVEAVTLTAMQARATAQELMMAMNAGDRPAVIERLKAEGVTELRGTPLDQVDDAVLRQTIVRAHQGAEMTLHSAPLRKAHLREETLSFGEAAKLLPDLGKKGSPEFNAFQAALNANPNVRTLGPNWPLLLAQNVAFALGRSKTTTSTMPPAAAREDARPTPPTPRSAPAAPRASAAVVPPTSELDEVRKRLNSGAGTKDDMERYARLNLRIG